MATKQKAAREAVARLREIVEKRLSALQAELEEQRENLTALDKERDLKAASMMAQTLGKVMELERKERAARDKRTKQRKVLRDTKRRQLAGGNGAVGCGGGGGGGGVTGGAGGRGGDGLIVIVCW